MLHTRKDEEDMNKQGKIRNTPQQQGPNFRTLLHFILSSLYTYTPTVVIIMQLMKNRNKKYL